MYDFDKAILILQAVIIIAIGGLAWLVRKWIAPLKTAIEARRATIDVERALMDRLETFLNSVDAREVTERQGSPTENQPPPPAAPPSNELLDLLVKQHEERHKAKEFLDIYLKMISLSYDKAAVYTNVVLIGGYGAFFALWATAHSSMYIPENLLRWAAILGIISVSTVVVFEVGKMIITTNSLTGYWKRFEASQAVVDPALIRQRFDDYDKHVARTNARFVLSWRLAVFLAAITALGAVGVLLTGFVHGLF